ncbi:hypothetical protein D3C81_2078920 [compost metagenome]
MSRSLLRLLQIFRNDDQQGNSYGDVDKHSNPPGNPLGQHSTQNQADAAASPGYRAVDGDGF